MGDTTWFELTGSSALEISESGWSERDIDDMSGETLPLKKILSSTNLSSSVLFILLHTGSCNSLLHIRGLIGRNILVLNLQLLQYSHD